MTHFGENKDTCTNKLLLRGYYTLIKNYHVFVLKIINTSSEKLIYACCCKLSKNSFKVGQAVVKLLIKNNFSTVLIHDVETAWPT